jgi:FKBP-type peptidyl-prolyl cis-trans isomerase FklB
MMKLNRLFVVTAFLAVGIASVQAAATDPNVTFKSDQEKLSYAIGCQIGNSLKSQETALDLPMLTQGLTQVLNGKTPSLTEDQIRQTIQNWQQEVQAKAAQKRKELGEKNLAEGKAFLEANAKKEGVKVLASGLQYKVIKDGTGKIPASTDKVKVNYRGTLTNGTEFDSSYKRNQPAEFPVTGVIKGWVEALQLMKEGSKWEIYVPGALAYGENGRPNIPPNSVLIFEVELLEIVKPDSTNATAAPAIKSPASTPSAKPAPAPAPTPAPVTKPK